MEELDIHTVASRAAGGVLALVSRTFFLNLISFAASLIIFTELSKTDIGIYTAVLAMQRVISFFTDFGLGAALIQKKEELTREDLVTTFTLQSIITFLIFLIVVLLSPFIASFFKLNSAGIGLLLVLVASIFLSSFKIIPSILLERKIQFNKLIVPQMLEAFVFNILIVILVLNKFGINSYTWAFLVSSLISIPVYLYISPWKMGFGINKDAVKHLKFGAQFQAKNILATIKDDLLTVMLAKFLTFTQIAYIGFAQRFAFFTYRYAVDSVTKVTFSALSRLQENKKHLQAAIEKSLFFVASIMFPTLFILMLSASSLIAYFPKWHGKWEPALVSLVFFSLNALVSSFSGILINVLDATGRVKTTLKLMVVWTIMTWTLTPILISIYGYNGVAIASFLITLTIFATIYLVRKIVYFDILGSLKKPAIATMMLCLSMLLGLKFIVHDLFTLIVAMILSGLVYALCMFLIARREIGSDIIILLRRK